MGRTVLPDGGPYLVRRKPWRLIIERLDPLEQGLSRRG